MSEQKYIRLEEVIDRLEREWGYEGMREDLSALPTYTPADILAGMWVPVSERLPDVEVKQTTGDWSYKVMFWCKPGFEAVGYYNHTEKYWMTADEVSTYLADDVTHWMPLPVAPKETKHG